MGDPVKPPLVEFRRILDLLVASMEAGKPWAEQSDMVEVLNDLVQNPEIPHPMIVDARVRIQSWLDREKVTLEGMELVDTLVDRLITREYEAA